MLSTAPPTLTAPTAAYADEYVPLNFFSDNSNAISLADTAARGISDSLTLSVAHGSLTLGSTTGLTFTTGTNSSALMTINGTLTNLNAALGGLVYMPTTGYSGSDQLDLTATNASDGLTGSAFVNITVFASTVTVTAPTTATVNENAPLTFSTANSNAISAVDTDSGATETLALTVTHGTLTLGSTTGLTFFSGTNPSASTNVFGTLADLNAALDGLTFTPTTGYFGLASLAVKVENDRSDLIAPANVTITVNASTVTVIAPTSGSLNENSPLTFSTGNGNAILLLDAQAVADSDTLALSVSNGTLTIASTTGVTFTSGTNNEASMTIWGTLTNINAALNGLVYTPTTGYFGSDSLVLTGQNTNNNLTASTNVALTITVPPPSLAGPTTGSLVENSSLTFSTGSGYPISLADTSAVADSDTLALSVSNGTLTLGSMIGLTFVSGTNNETSMTIWGTLADINAALSGLVYTPTTGYLGSDSLVLTAENTNNNLTDSSSVALTVSGPPTLTAPAAATVNENEIVIFSTTYAGVISLTDPDAASSGTFDSLTLSVTHGIFGLDSTMGLKFLSGRDHTASMTVTGTLANLSAALNDLLYKPSPNYVGADSLTVSVANSFDGLSTSATIALTVQALPPPAVTAPTTATVNENTSLTFSTDNGNAISVSDPEASGAVDKLTLSVMHGTLALGSTTGLTFVTGNNGSASMTVEGTLSNLTSALSGLVFTPTTGYVGTDSLAVTVLNLTDSLMGSANVAIEVGPPAVRAPATANVNENSTLTFSPRNSNAISLVDALATAGSDTVKLTVAHGKLTSGSTTGLTFSSGTNGLGSMTFYGTVANLNAALNGLTYTPTTGYAGSDSLAILVTNYHDSLTASANAALTVIVPPPSVTAPATANTAENSTLTFSVGNSNAISLMDAMATAGSDTVTLTVTHGKLTLGSTTGITFSSGVNGAAAMTFFGTVANLNATLNGLKYTPTTGYSGPDTLAITIKNYHDNLSVSANVAITV